MSNFHSFFFFYFIFHATTTIAITKTCPESHCPGTKSLPIRFPFRLKQNQTKRCGYNPHFDLSCDRNDTIISIPAAGEFNIKSINYKLQTIRINEPKNCMPKLWLKLNFSSNFLPFDVQNYYSRRVTFFNCTSGSVPAYLTRVSCLSGDGDGFAVAAGFADRFDGSGRSCPCQVISTVSVPMKDVSGYELGLYEDVTLAWSVPGCGGCEVGGGACGFKRDVGLETECSDPYSSSSSAFGSSSNSGIPSAKYIIIAAIGLPGLLCLIGLILYLSGQLVAQSPQYHGPNTDLLTSHPDIVIMGLGLDKPTIESYPTIIFSESNKLSKANDNTCPICLYDYHANDTLRTIPHCNHYFHANCIDQWLRISGTCPLCRICLWS